MIAALALPTNSVLEFLAVWNHTAAPHSFEWLHTLLAPVLPIFLASLDHAFLPNFLEGIGAGNALAILVDTARDPDLAQSVLIEHIASIALGAHFHIFAYFVVLALWVIEHTS